MDPLSDGPARAPKAKPCQGPYSNYQLPPPRPPLRPPRRRPATCSHSLKTHPRPPARPRAAAPPLPVPHRHVCAPARARVSACVPPPPHALGISGSLMKVALTMLPLN